MLSPNTKRLFHRTVIRWRSVSVYKSEHKNFAVSPLCKKANAIYDEETLVRALMQDVKGLWQSVLGELEVSVSRASFSTWFRQTAIVSNEDGRVVIAVP